MKTGKKTEPEYYEPTYRGRPLKVVEDQHGERWLCDQDVDPKGNLKNQGCWRCDEVTFPIGGR